MVQQEIKLSVHPPSQNECPRFIFNVSSVLENDHRMSYKPQLVSIGPYHRNRRHLRMMENHKQRYLQNLIQRVGVTEEYLVTEIAVKETEIRDSYWSPFNNIIQNDFLKMVVVDGCFVIEFFRMRGRIVRYSTGDPLFSILSINSILLRDLMLAENQLPFTMLELLYNKTKVSEPKTLSALIVEVLNDHFNGSLNFEWSNQTAKHLLDLVRQSLIPTPPKQGNGISDPQPRNDNSDPQQGNDNSDLVRTIPIPSSDNSNVPGNSDPQQGNDNSDLVRTIPIPSSDNSNVPINSEPQQGNDNSNVPGNSDPQQGNDNPDLVRTIPIPSSDNSNVPVHSDPQQGNENSDPQQRNDNSDPQQGNDNTVPIPSSDKSNTTIPILGIEYLRRSGIQICLKDGHESPIAVEFDRGKLRMPTLELTDVTFPLFRNFVCLEQCSVDSSKEITTYFFFLSSLIRTEEDMNYLCKKRIIVNAFDTSATVLSLIHQMLAGASFNMNNCYLAELFDEVNKYCGRRWRTHLATLNLKYFHTPWSIISFVAAFILVLFTVISAVFTVISCYHSGK